VTSLKKLQTEYVDLFLIHKPTDFAAPGQLKNIWKQMEEVKREGLAKSIGVSNFDVETFEQILDGVTVVPAVNQVSQSTIYR
jgi:diketogulonate reductase-like aldo/keto reductase